MIFIDLRDREGVVQVGLLRADPDNATTFKTAESLRNEFVVRVSGRVRPRPDGTINKNLVSGEIEVLAGEIEILNPSLTPPFMMDDEQLSENIRLEYRFLDLRRPQMQKNLQLRHRAAMSAREYLDKHGFIDIETPMLYKSTPEGAREFLVPSRIHDGYFYALPQSPQLFKQLLMIAGFDRYYQIVEESLPRRGLARRPSARVHADRYRNLPSSASARIQDLMEGLIRHMFKQSLDVELPPFPRIAYAEAMARYGSGQARPAR